MLKLIDEFRRGWHGTSQPSLLFSVGFAASCLALSTAARWCLSLIRPDVFFTPYIPAVFFAAAFGGYRVGIATALLGGVLGATVNFSDAQADFARMALMVMYLIVCGLMIWGIEHYRSVALHQREISKRLIREEEYRKLVVDELQHRLKNKLSTIHAVLHQVLQDQPADTGAGRDRRSDRQGRRQRLRHQGSVALRTRTLRPRSIYPERRAAVSPGQIGREPCIDISRTRHQRRKVRRIFFGARAVAGVVVGVRRSPQHCLGRDRGSSGRQRRAARIRDQVAQFGAHAFRWQERDYLFENRGSLHHAVPHTAGVSGSGPDGSLRVSRYLRDFVDPFLMTSRGVSLRIGRHLAVSPCFSMPLN